MLRLRPTFEEIEREARTSRLRILPERQRRTQQGILLDEVDFDDFDLSKYDRKTILNDSNNPEKGTQTDTFNETESESMKPPEEDIKEESAMESEESIKIGEKEREREREREQPQKKSVMRRVFDAMFGEDDASASSGQSRDEFKEEREEMRNRRQQIEEDDYQRETPIEPQKSEESDNCLPMNVKKSYEPSSESSSSRRSSNRSVLLLVEEEALSEYINSSQPETVESSNRTIEYVDDATPPQSVISSRRSQETIEYIRSRRSSRASVQSVSS